MSNEKEIDYQAYIDQLHAEIADLKHKNDSKLMQITQLSAENRRYQEALLKAFEKWGRTR